MATRSGFRSLGVDGLQKILVFNKLMDSAPIYLTGNTETVYGTAFFDLSDGPMIIESPGQLSRPGR